MPNPNKRPNRTDDTHQNDPKRQRDGREETITVSSSSSSQQPSCSSSTQLPMLDISVTNADNMVFAQPLSQETSGSIGVITQLPSKRWREMSFEKQMREAMPYEFNFLTRPLQTMIDADFWYDEYYNAVEEIFKHTVDTDIDVRSYLEPDTIEELTADKITKLITPSDPTKTSFVQALIKALDEAAICEKRLDGYNLAYYLTYMVKHHYPHLQLLLDAIYQAVTPNDQLTQTHWQVICRQPLIGPIMEATSTYASSLHYAVALDNIEAAKELITQASHLIHTQDRMGRPPLFVAASIGNLAVLPQLINEVTLNLQDNDGRTALHMAAQCGHVDAVQCLLQKGAAVDVTNNHGWTPLIWAAANGHAKIVQLLLEYNADMEKITEDGGTALHLAAAHNHPEVIALLLAKGANTKTSDTEEQGPLHAALIANAYSRPGTKTVRLLLRYGTPIEAEDKDGWRPLHWAVEADVATVKLLLIKGAKIDATTRAGETALHLAVKESFNIDMIKLLLDKGAPIEVTDNEGATPLYRAVQAGNLAAVEALITAGASLANLTLMGIDARLFSDVFMSTNEYSSTAKCINFLIKQGLYVPGYLQPQEGEQALPEAIIVRAKANQLHETEHYATLYALLARQELGLEPDTIPMPLGFYPSGETYIVDLIDGKPSAIERFISTATAYGPNTLNNWLKGLCGIGFYGLMAAARIQGHLHARRIQLLETQTDTLNEKNQQFLQQLRTLETTVATQATQLAQQTAQITAQNIQLTEQAKHIHDLQQAVSMLMAASKVTSTSNMASLSSPASSSERLAETSFFDPAFFNKAPSFLTTSFVNDDTLVNDDDSAAKKLPS